MDRVRGLVKLVFVLGGAWLILEPVVHKASPTDLIGPALAALVVIYVGHAIAGLIPD